MELEEDEENDRRENGEPLDHADDTPLLGLFDRKEFDASMMAV